MSERSLLWRPARSWPRYQVPLRCLLSPSALPRHPLQSWLQLPGRWSSGLGKQPPFYLSLFVLPVPQPGSALWDLPPASQEKELQGGPEPGFTLRPLLHAPAMSSSSGCRRQAFFPHLSAPPPSPVTSRVLEPSHKLLPYTFLGSHPSCLSPRVLRSLSAYWRGDWASCFSFVQAWGLGGRLARSRPL